MNTLIFKTTTTYLLPLLLLFSVFILLRGHYLPGGGFIGGLIASIAFILHALAFGLNETKKLLRIHPGFLLPFGLLVAALAGISPLILEGNPFMTGVWFPEALPVVGNVGSALFFDIGVFLVVIGASLTIILTIYEGA
ncbi:MAG: Na+/H+ antiporter subunit B [Luteibaculaceae bacterium]